MTPVELIQKARAEGVILTLTEAGKIKIAGRREIVARWTETLREYKPELIEALAAEVIRARAWEALEADPDLTYAIETHDPESDPVRVTIARRHVGACDLLIPRDKYDPWLMLEVLQRQGRPN